MYLLTILRGFEPPDYGGQVSSNAVAAASTPGSSRRSRQEETARKLVGAALETLRASSYAGLTVRGVAARANVAPATAYTYFSSKNHLVAEVYLDLVRRVDYFTDVNDDDVDRVRQTLRSLALVVADARTVAALEMSYFGALVQAGSGAFSYRQIADRLGYVAGLILHTGDR